MKQFPGDQDVFKCKEVLYQVGENIEHQKAQIEQLQLKLHAIETTLFCIIFNWLEDPNEKFF